MPRKFDPLGNSGTSRVFYQMVKGSSTTKELAEKLNLKPSSVSEQLRRLERIRIVKKGIKEGKFQIYEVDWNRFIEAFINRYPWTLKDSIEDLTNIIEDIDRSMDKHVKNLKPKWRRNESFKKLVQSYFESLPEKEQSSIPELIFKFEKELNKLILSEKHEYKDEKIKEFLPLLEDYNQAKINALKRVLEEYTKSLGLEEKH